jgi:hypothetical protein
MKCLRCGGAMFMDKFYSPNDCFWGLKCVICGEIIDPLILKNRLSMNIVRELSQPQKRKSLTRLSRAGNQLNPAL